MTICVILQQHTRPSLGRGVPPLEIRQGRQKGKREARFSAISTVRQTCSYVQVGAERCRNMRHGSHKIRTVRFRPVPPPTMNGEKMMRDDGGYAFRNPTTVDDEGVHTLHKGMSLRDWFAGQAVAPLMLAANTERDMTYEEQAKAVAELSYAVADAMIAARKDTP